MSKKRKKLGMSPGSIVYTGKRGVEKVLIHTSTYNKEFIDETVQNNKEKIILDAFWIIFDYFITFSVFFM